jgi:hypothetical protein
MTYLKPPKESVYATSLGRGAGYDILCDKTSTLCQHLDSNL